MDAIRKKMQSLKAETENLYETIKSVEEETRLADEVANRCDTDIRDIRKRISILEADFDATNDRTCGHKCQTGGAGEQEL